MTVQLAADVKRDMRLSRTARKQQADWRLGSADNGARSTRGMARNTVWLQRLVVLTLLWPLLYGPVVYLLATGWRPPWAVLAETLLVLCVAHTLAVFVGWGSLWSRARRLRQTRQQEFEATRTLDQLRALSPMEFENWTAALFARHGYRVVNTPPSADHGVDLLITGRDGRQAVVQCKRYHGTVGERAVRDLYGTVVHTGADWGYLVTTGNISQAAHIWAQGKPLEMIDGERLVRLAS